MIYDCFNFYNEIDILELRLNILYPHVDKFVIVESSVTHSGVEKPFYLDLYREKFSKFEDKILNYKIYDTPRDFVNLPETDELALQQVHSFIRSQCNRFDRRTQPDYGRDFFQKESVRRALVDCDDNDIIIVSDADEIPNPDTVKSLDLTKGMYRLNQTTYYYYLNVLKQRDWCGSRVALYKNIKDVSLNELRGDDLLTTEVKNGGWHFSFMGGEKMVKNKLISYSARDLVNRAVLENIETNMKSNIDPFFRSKLETVKIDETYPQYLLDNIEYYKSLGMIK